MRQLTDTETRLPIVFFVSKVGPSDFTDENFFGENMDNSFDRYSLVSALIGKTVTNETFYAMADSLNAASPLYFITENVPPTLMAYGEKDTLVPFSNGTALRDKLVASGVACDFYSF